ncbi:MAG: NAD-dependent epimerase/dehydratase family protein, partial [Candidatus Binataceae bacterium]
MRVLLVGATGLIGSAIAARLHELGHDIVAVIRDHGPASARLPAAESIRIDLRGATEPKMWLPHLNHIDAIVNCAGVLQDSPRDATRQVHVDGIGALFRACEAASVRRVIQISTIGLDRETPTEFSRTKLAGDRLLMSLDLDWVILRPSVVVGRAAYGGSALFRGLAALPFLPITPGTGLLQIVQLDDVVRTVELLLPPGAPARLVLELAGPERLAFEGVVAAYRRWL